MKKILFAFLTFGMLIGLASCEKELTGDDKDKENQGSVESVQLEVKGRILTDGDKASKVTGELELVQGEKESVKLVPSWQVGDEICGFVDGKVSTTLRFKVNSIVDGTALFSWSGEGNVPELNTGTKVHVLYFPFSSVPTNGEFKVDYSDVDGTLESALKHAVLCADGVVTSDEGSGKRYLDLDFENMMSIFRVYGLKYPDDTPVPAGATISVSAERGFTDHATVKFNTNVTPNKFQFYLDKTCYTSALNLTLKTAKIYEKGEGGSYEEVEVPCAYFVLPASDKWNTNDWNPAWRGWNNGQTSETSAPFTGITEFFVVVKGKDGKELYYAKAGEGDTQKIDKKVEANKLYNVAKGMKTKENGYDDYEFAPGNLQYRKIKVGDEWKDQWRFAQNSFDIIGGYSNQGMYEGNVFEEDGTRYDNTKIVDYYGGWSSHVQIQSDRTYCYVPQDSLEAIKASGKIVYSSSFPNEYYQGWMDLFAFGTSGYEKTLPYAVYNGSYTPMYHTIEDMYARENLYNAEGPTYYDWGHYLDGKDGRPGIEGDMYPGEWMTLN
ncbi:MAG: hypothetical protein KBT00_07750, partial [Bacteroidales bacterium]|nr:hypothetical protein [Candidatus Cacconaster merdequi]